MLEAASAAMPVSETLRLMAEFGSTTDGCWSSRDVDMRNSRCTHAAKRSPIVEKSAAAPASGSVNLSIRQAHRSAKYGPHGMLKMKSDLATDFKHQTIVPQNLDSDPLHFLDSRDLKEPSR